MKITQKRVVYQDWYETEYSKTGWDSHGWQFYDGGEFDETWLVVSQFLFDKFGNPRGGISVKETEIEI